MLRVDACCHIAAIRYGRAIRYAEDVDVAMMLRRIRQHIRYCAIVHDRDGYWRRNTRHNVIILRYVTLIDTPC